MPKGDLLLYIGVGDGYHAMKIGEKYAIVIGCDIIRQNITIAKFNMHAHKPTCILGYMPRLKKAFCDLSSRSGKSSLDLIVADGRFLPFKRGIFNVVLIGVGPIGKKNELMILKEAIRVSNAYVLLMTRNLRNLDLVRICIERG